MTVYRILAMKGSNVVTSAPHRTLHETVTLLTDKGIGAVVVTGADGEVLGILSERDVIKALARQGDQALQDAVSKYMTQKVVTATEQTGVVEAMSQMTNGRFRHMPVVRDGRLIGLISIGDVVKHRLEEMERENQHILDYIGTS